MKNRKSKMNSLLICSALFFPTIFSTQAYANSTLYELLSKGGVLVVLHEDGDTYTVKFTDDGRYVTSQGARGKYEIRDTFLCTTRDEDSGFGGRAGKRDCGELPKGKRLGDVWVMKSNRGGNVTVSIVKSES